MTSNDFIDISNAQTIPLSDIPVIDYPRFMACVTDELRQPANHCLNYYGVADGNRYWFICCIACDETHRIRLYSHEAPKSITSLDSLTPECPQLYIFEREIHENFGINFDGHPWLKPVRWPFDRHNPDSNMNNYPFYAIPSEELHEVGVGPIHAGVIEPGHFRFICNGEKVLHLEIHLGYQHRGAEKLVAPGNGLQRALLCESIAGDTSVASSVVHAQLIESLAGIEVSQNLQLERCMGLELERIAVHVGDTAALCADVAYQLGQVVNEALRTTFINTTQYWCGNRFGKGLVRPGGTHYPLSDDILREIRRVLGDSGKRYFDIADRIYTLPTVLARFDGIGSLSHEQTLTIGAVGMAARTAQLARDIRKSHPFQYYNSFHHQPVLLETGDVLARGMLRYREVQQSVELIDMWGKQWEAMPHHVNPPVYDYRLRPASFAISAAEAWRGELCHTAITDADGNLIHYKVKDPSLHNWMALALAVRNQEISDFPICNKSFNLSYCGYDL
ncbi:MAG: NADH-quinone oxidoreductase subunit C [Bacteroidales bacterium]|nr:NADH-quinone oxidoreductase subunit C [Bacteroidales bacterium]